MIKPIFSEKSLSEAKKGRYTFWVDRSVNKFQIKNIVHDLFDVDVTTVATINYKGGTRRTLRGKTVKTAPYKKAIVVLKKDQKIDLWEAEKKSEKKTTKKKTK